MRPHKGFVIFTAAAALAVAGPVATAGAQPRGHAHGGGRVVVVGGGYYRPYPYYYASFAFDPWYGAQYPYPYPYPMHPYAAAPDASVRLDVKPRQAEVYVDGYYAGIVDDFDGNFQRLRLEPGDHVIELWMDGYKSVHQKVYLTPDNTFRIKYQMEHLPQGQPPDPKPQPTNPPPPEGGNQPRMQQPPMQQPPMTRGPEGRRMPQPPPQGDPRGGGQDPRGRQDSGAYGSLAVRVQPRDAEISIDGEPWRAPGGQERLVVEVAEGSHTVEIRKPGFRTYVTQVDVRRGQTTPLNVSLRGEQQ